MGRCYEMGEEKDSEYYDEKYSNSLEYNKRPEDCVYYNLWSTILKSISKTEKILDIGCGSGQFAELAIKKGYKYSRGVDFSKVSIDIAKINNKSNKGKFIVGDVTNPDIYNVEYDVVVICEVLEHIDNDIGVLKNIKSGKHIIATVPSYDSAGHVRFFNVAKEVCNRYKTMINGGIIEIPIRNSKIFLIDGVLI